MHNSNAITAYIALGGNLADSAGYINKALEKLAATDATSVEAVSSMIKTAPLGGMEQPDYLNAVVRIKTTLAAENLYEQMVDIENALGRKRGEKWATRTIDLDLLLYDDAIIETATLTVPHSQMHLRSFVLRGMCELDADLIHPVLKRSMAELAGRLRGNDFVVEPKRPQLISVAGVIGVGKTTLAKDLCEVLDGRLLAEAYDENPFLADEYAGKKEVALDSELYFLNSRIGQLDSRVLSAGQVVISDYVFDKQMIYARQWLDRRQLAAFEKRNNAAVETIVKPVLVIYMKNSLQTCLERIHERNRPYEQQIKLQMLKNLSDNYERLFAEWDVCPVITLQGDEFDCMDRDDVKKLASEVSCYICK